MHHSRGAQIRHDPPAGQGGRRKRTKQLNFPTEGDVQGDRRDDPHGGQERGREDQLRGVPGHDQPPEAGGDARSKCF